tara:strand:+ start:119159 stop:120730 length:1572 start_codon:yes stop_codon:yes gene_type:complete
MLEMTMREHASELGTTAPTRKPTDSTSPIQKERFGYAEARHLLLRAGFGGTDEQIRTLAEWGPERAVDHLVNYDSIPFKDAGANDFDSDIIQPLSDEQRRSLQRARARQDEDTIAAYRTARQRAQREDRRQMREIQRSWLTRMVQSPRPLEEKLTLFWHGHFATSFRIVEDSYHMYAQNRLFRGNASGNFGRMLRGIIRDPAMLRYLNNNMNRKNAPNENLGRELLELFSLGEGNYTERDIKEAARTLTGFTYEDNSFSFNQNQHDQGTKFVLGVRGNLDGDSLVSAILNQEACALFLSFKLYKFFVRDIPLDLSQLDSGTRRAILELAQIMRISNYELQPVLRRLLLSRHFYDPINMGSKIKSPSELLVGAVRSLKVPVRDIGVMSEAMDLMGQSVYYPPSVKGWDGGRSWINTSTMFVRQNTLIYLLTGALPTRSILFRDQQNFDAVSLVPSLNTPDDVDPSDEQIIRELAAITLGEVSDETIATVLHGARGDADEGAMRDNEALVRALVLLTSMPEYQLC